ncbi:hypothetical protein PFMALIP_01620 [Plasmodium falciparum MaliPS096_E11]|uniref:Uncharacterized protein n=1 Tax=Plasmodium falciparum MaliPS096_E11 TaxID=1036727 RepID=A0A024WSX6_PLAFA|nr:hypothetical protein PFMALIP_01620 [Plasmodium falciparum MaliPS096_E11]
MIQLLVVYFLLLLLFFLLYPQNVQKTSLKKQNRIFHESNLIQIRSLAEAPVEKPLTHTRNKYSNEPITNSFNASAQGSVKATTEKNGTKPISKRNEQVNNQTINRPTYNSSLYNPKSPNDRIDEGSLQNVLQGYKENHIKYAVDTLDLREDIKDKFKELLCLNVNRSDPNRQYKLYKQIKKHIQKYEDHPMISSLVDLENIEDDIYFLQNPDRAKHIVYDTAKENRRKKKKKKLEKQKLEEEKKIKKK